MCFMREQESEEGDEVGHRNSESGKGRAMSTGSTEYSCGKHIDKAAISGQLTVLLSSGVPRALYLPTLSGLQLIYIINT